MWYVPAYMCPQSGFTESLRFVENLWLSLLGLPTGYVAGFAIPTWFIMWINECVTTTTFSRAINGGLYGFFREAKGLRQGDPLSSYLFGICMDYLSKLLHQQILGPNFHFHPNCDDLRISHLVYADNLLLFSKGDIPSVMTLSTSLA